MHKDQLYTMLDSIKLAIDSSVDILNANNSEWTDSRVSNIASARTTIDLAQRKMRDILDLDFETIDYKDSYND